MDDFLAELRRLDKAAIPAPWKVYESDNGEGGLVHRRASGMVRPVADFPGSGESGSEASDASVDLTELLRNHASRLADVVEAAGALRHYDDPTVILRAAVLAPLFTALDALKGDAKANTAAEGAEHGR